jgi:hypothetical protein
VPTVAFSVIIPAHYANFYADLTAPTHHEIPAIFAHTVPGAQQPGWLLSAFTNLTEHHVLAYLGDDNEVHFIHRLSHYRASVQCPTTCFDGAYVGIIDKINAFGRALGAIDWLFFDKVGVDATPGAAAITAALAGGTEGQLTAVPNDAMVAEVDLPPIWARLAKVGPKHSCLLDAAARAAIANGTHSLPSVGCPLISPELAREVSGLQFFGRCEDLECCLSIFAVSFLDTGSVTATNDIIGL